MHGSDEEIDDQPEVGSDEDFSDDGNKDAHEEVYYFLFLNRKKNSGEGMVVSIQSWENLQAQRQLIEVLIFMSL